MAPAARVLLLVTRQLTPVRLMPFAPAAARGYLLVLTQPHRPRAAGTGSSAATASSCDGEQRPQAPSATPGTATGPREGEAAAARGVSSKAAAAQDDGAGAAAASPAASKETLLAAKAGRRRRRRRPSSPKAPGGPKQGRGGRGGIIHDVPSSASSSSN
ncbi:hypothetical protein BS78_07G060900 [Paspalum vaginatum]|nr:hypothetical protein BS78_07G060900 [Paspalum vaginatum]